MIMSPPCGKMKAGSRALPLNRQRHIMLRIPSNAVTALESSYLIRTCVCDPSALLVQIFLIRSYICRVHVSRPPSAYWFHLTSSLTAITGWITLTWPLWTPRECYAFWRMNCKKRRMPEIEVRTVPLSCSSLNLLVVWLLGHVLTGWTGSSALRDPTNLCKYYLESVMHRELIASIQFTKCQYGPNHSAGADSLHKYSV